MSKVGNEKGPKLMTTSNAPTSIRSTDALEREARYQAIDDRGTEIEIEEAEAWITTFSHSLGPLYQEVRAMQDAISRFQHNINDDRIEEPASAWSAG